MHYFQNVQNYDIKKLFLLIENNPNRIDIHISVNRSIWTRKNKTCKRLGVLVLKIDEYMLILTNKDPSTLSV